MAENVDWKNVQGLVRRSYSATEHALYVMFAVHDPAKVKAWLQQVRKMICYGEGKHDKNHSHQPFHFNIAFSCNGLKHLGLNPNTLNSFAAEFREGMVGTNPKNPRKPTSRSARLGDVGHNSPRQWKWGAKSGKETHIILMVFAHTPTDADHAVDKICQGDAVACGLRLLNSIPAFMDKNNPREHFGFKDGISQPKIDDPNLTRSMKQLDKAVSVVKAGEFIMGYKDQRSVVSESPIVLAAHGGNDTLPKRSKGKWDLGKNGSYVVVRQLRQDVQEFEQFLEDKYHDPRGFANIPHRARQRRTKQEWKDWLAAKMVGRWKNGMPLTNHPEKPPNTYDPTKANRFVYYDGDLAGLSCPAGAHIRRSNPRDSLEKDPALALHISKHRRIIRRGRIYGHAYDPLVPDNSTGKNERGLMFICLNSNIAGQFESIQHDWLNSPQFDQLYEESDPLLGLRSQSSRSFTVPARPTNIRFAGVSQFVTVRGGGYFFLPGRQALKWIAKLI